MYGGKEVLIQNNTPLLQLKANGEWFCGFQVGYPTPAFNEALLLCNSCEASIFQSSNRNIGFVDV